MGENRDLVKLGLKVLNETNRIGLKELIKGAGINYGKKLDSYHIGLQLGLR